MRVYFQKYSIPDIYEVKKPPESLCWGFKADPGCLQAQGPPL